MIISCCSNTLAHLVLFFSHDFDLQLSYWYAWGIDLGSQQLFNSSWFSSIPLVIGNNQNTAPTLYDWVMKQWNISYFYSQLLTLDLLHFSSKFTSYMMKPQNINFYHAHFIREGIQRISECNRPCNFNWDNYFTNRFHSIPWCPQ